MRSQRNLDVYVCIYIYICMYIYIWVNSNISLTWNKAMAGDDSPKINHNFQFGRTVRSLFHLPRLERFYMNQTIHDLINLHDFGIFHYSPSNSLGARDFPWNKLTTKPSSYRVSPQKTSVFSEKWGICELKKTTAILHEKWIHWVQKGEIQDQTRVSKVAYPDSEMVGITKLRFMLESGDTLQ